MHYRSLITCLILFLLARSVSAAMTSANFQIGWDDVNGGGSDSGASANFQIRDTVGDQGAGLSASANFQISGGYRALGDVSALSLVFKGQTNASRTAYSAFSAAGNAVTVASVLPFSVGDHIAVVENLGFSQQVAVGKITSIVGLVLNIDGWAGDQALIGALPAGGDDFVYALADSTAAFGSIVSGGENTAVAMTSVQSEAPLGYSVYLQADQILQDINGHTIAAVTDGSVSIGSEEYGAVAKGALAVDPGTDVGVTTTQRAVQESAGPTGAVPDRVAQVYKLSVTNSTTAGVYGHTIIYTLTANY